MENWIIWFIAAGILVILEICSGTFYLLMVAIGMIAGGIVALLGGNFSLQLVVAAIICVTAGYAVYRSKVGGKPRINPANDPNINLDIGQKVVVDKWQSTTDGTNQARIMYRGALWDAELVSGVQAKPGTYIVREVRGHCLIVDKGNTD